jgi:uncharacterized protein YjbI with pentapeptide repeats
MSKLITKITDLVIDGSKIADKKDTFKDFFNDYDEVLSSSSWGKLVKYMAEKAYIIEDFDDAYYFTIYTTYLNTFIEALDHFNINENNFAIPNRETIEFDHKEFDRDKITSNSLKIYFDEVFKNFVEKDDWSKIQKYVNSNIKYNYYKVLKNEELALKKYIDHIKSDLGIEDGKRFKKEIYKRKVEQEYHDIVLGDENGLTLADLYIEPYFRVHKTCFKTNDKRYKKHSSYDTKYFNVEDENIHFFVENILNGKNTHDLNIEDVDTIFIAGQPGQGKSSFTKRFVNDVVNSKIVLDKEVIFIKLKDIPEPTDLMEKNIKDVIAENTKFEVEDFSNYIIVLDGLDELAMKTGLTLSNIDTICQKLSRSDLTVIVTTRHGYVNFDSLNEKNIVIVELKELNKEQQIKWLDKYKITYPNLKFTNKTIEDIHKKENKDKNKHILELINQPILLHMIASMEFDNISDLTKSSLYEKFFDNLIKRNWEKTQHPLSDGIDEEEYKLALKNMLKELAFTIYNSDFEYIHKIEFEKLGSVIELQNLLSEHSNNKTLKNNLKGIMISFYFKEIKKDEDDEGIEERSEKYAIEFLHKSLMEYMVALNAYDIIFDEFLETKRKTGKYVIDDGKKALEKLWVLFNKKSISYEVISNLENIIKENENQAEKDELAKRFDKFLPYFVEKDFLYEYSIDNNSYPSGKMKSVLIGFWIVFSNLNNKNHMSDNLKIKERLIDKLRLLSNYSYINLDYSDLSNLNLDYTVFSRNLNTINFRNSNAHRMNIYNFSYDSKEKHKNTNLNEMKYMSKCYIEGVDFKDCEFKIEDIHDTEFDLCDFINVSFNTSFYGNCIFRNCIFRNCLNIDFEKLRVDFINCTNNEESI